MATDAYSIEALKEFSYRVEINGLPVAMVQEFNPGSSKIGVSERAGAGQNHVIKEAGMLSFDHATLKSVVPIEGAGLSYWQDWMNQVQDPKTGIGTRPKQYKRNFSVYNIGPDGTPLRVWEFYGGWISEYKPGDLKSKEDKNDVIEEVQITYDHRELRTLA
jgi:phage tail-like protein